MKKGLLLSLSLAFSVGVFAQGASRLPNGFRKAEVPASMKNRKMAVPARHTAIDNGIPDNNNSSRRLVAPQSTTVNTYLLSEYLVGLTYYDLQSNASMSHRLERRPYGVGTGNTKISAAWTFSPSWTAAEDFPLRGTGYNYSSDDGVTWQFPYVAGLSQGPTARTESARTGFTNIVTTRNGSEMSIAHNGSGIAINRRTQTGTGAWTYGTPFGTATDFWPKACADGDTVYAVWQGSGTAGTVVQGQDGPIWFSYSTDAGATWMPKSLIPGIDSTQYLGFGGDDYNIDAKNGTVAIVIGSTTTDLLLMKSSDLGVTWTKTVILHCPFPLFNSSGSVPSDTDNDGVADFIFATVGDGSVLLDNAGMAHVWFSDYYWLFDSTVFGTATYYISSSADGLEYWNESMPTGGYVMIAAAQDLNGDSVLNIPTDTTCSTFRKWGNYRGGITGMPSSGIDANGTMYVTYQTIDELADTTNYLLSHMHVYMTTSSDGGQTWTYPYDIVPTTVEGGDGEHQEAVFASMARYVDDKVCVLYQRDGAPGTALATAGSCDDNYNSGNPSDIVFARINALTVNTNNVKSGDLFVSQSYPNPTSGMAYVNVSIKKAGNINVIVTDMLGKVVYTNVQSDVVAGTSTIALNTAKWNAGIYNYTITSGSQKVSKKMIVQ